jgi:predicted lipoprotein
VTTSGRGWLVVGVVATAWLAIARPWTIRPIAGQSNGPFDAAAYAARIWDSRAVPAIRSRAVPFAAFQSQRMMRPTPVWLDGVVVDVNVNSRVGTASIDANPVDGHPDALLMIGPVIRGTALRDGLDFIHFSDFTNQLQFATVATALNERVLATVLKGISPEALAGHPVQLVGVAWTDSSTPGALPLIVPVQLSHGGRP